jgi:hypothetical protein
MQFLTVEIKILDWNKVENNWADIVKSHFDTKAVVSMAVQTDLSSHTANEVKLSDGET